jgi:hypothetical protein
LVALAVIGAIALLALLAIRLMMTGMMGLGMGMMNCCQNMLIAVWALGLAVAVGLIAAIAYVIRRRFKEIRDPAKTNYET